MIKSIKLVNFFSFKQETVAFNADLNICVGINGSGKSNLLKAIALLKSGVEGNSSNTALQDLVVSRYGGFDNLFCQAASPTAPDAAISLEFLFDRAAVSAYGYDFQEDVLYQVTLKRQAGIGNYFVSERMTAGSQLFLEFYNGQGHVAESAASNGNGHSSLKLVNYVDYAPQELALSTVSAFDKDRYLPLLALKRALKDIHIYTYFDTTAEGKMRQAMSATSTVKHLLPDGRNLPQILNFIKLNDRSAYKKIQERLKEVNPYFQGLDFNVLGGSGVLELMLDEGKLNRAVHVSHISDGTLRYLCLMAILYNPLKGKLICIDEPEIGLHPDMIYNLGHAIKDAALASTIVISTHSAELLNTFDLDRVLVFEKDEENLTSVS